MADAVEKKSIEEMFDILENTISELERDDVSLEKSFKLFEEGMKLVSSCEKEIDLVEKKVLELSAGGNTVEFS